MTALAVLVVMSNEFTVSEEIENGFSCENVVTKNKTKNTM
jgi:hypothetical protein